MIQKDLKKFISAKDLGGLALPSFCARCFWYERYVSKPPSIFPGIFSTLDSLTKKGTLLSFRSDNAAPDWLPIPNTKWIVEGSLYMEMKVEWGDWILTGYPDDIFELQDETYHIVDYKVARFTKTQDELFPMYEVQLNGYALMSPSRGIKPISGLTLVYCEPKDELEDHKDYLLGFSINPKSVEINSDILPPLLIKARQILDNTYPPIANPNCKGICKWLGQAIGRGGENYGSSKNKSLIF